MEKGEARHIDARLFDLEKTLDIDTMLHCRVRDALLEHWNKDGQEYDREHSLYLAHYWQQAIDSDKNALLIPHNPREVLSGAFQGNQESWTANEYIAKQVVSNYDEFKATFKTAVMQQGLIDILDQKTLVVATNHQTYMNPAEVAHGLAIAFKELYGMDIRKDTHIAIGPRITTHATPDGMYLPDLLSTYSNWFLTIPATSRSQIPETDELSKIINKSAVSTMLNIKKTPGQILIIAPSGGRDTPEGGWSEEPSDASYSLVSPTNTSVLLPIAISDKGIDSALSSEGGPVNIGVSIGDVFETDNGEARDKGYVKHIVSYELYGELLAEAESGKL